MKAKNFIWEIETKISFDGRYKWRVKPSPSNPSNYSATYGEISSWAPWQGSYRFRNSAIKRARRFCRKYTKHPKPWRDVERVKL